MDWGGPAIEAPVLQFDSAGRPALHRRSLPVEAIRRISILGGPGSGKSTLSMALHQILSLPLIRLNDLTNEWTLELGREPDSDEWIARLRERLSSGDWIADGYFLQSLDTRFEFADVTILLDLPLSLCLLSAVQRGVKNLLGWPTTAHSDYRQTLARRISYLLGLRIYRRIWEFHRHRRLQLQQKLASLDSQKVVILFRRRHEVNAFLRDLAASVPPL